MPNVPYDEFNLQIPFPRPTQNLHRGYFVTDAPRLRPRTFRISDEEYEMARKAAQEVGISFGEFIRWCAYHCAMEVLNEVERQTFTRSTTNQKMADYDGYK